jgi:Tfp pilus tip-associated adhesin PilY1
VVDGTVKPVVVVGGGYHNCEDGSATGDCSAGKGSAIYVLDAATGAVIRSFATVGRVPSDVAVVDVDYDGLPDYAYVGDTRGNVYRVSFGRSKTAPLASAAWTSTRVAYTTGASRKFMYAPALLPGFDRALGKYYVYLALGTGDREQPLETQYPYATPVVNRFYVYMDDVTSDTAKNLDDATHFNDFTSNTACGGSIVIPGSSKSGWFMDLNQYGRGEQTVSGAVIVGGLVAFSTNRPVPRTANACAPLGEARGYWVNLFNASGAIGSVDIACGGDRSGTFAGGGLPPTPVVADVQVDGRVETVVLGAANKKGGASSSLQAQRGFTLKPQKRTRLYYRQEGNN